MNDKPTDLKAVFKAKVNERLTLRPNQWNGEDSAAVTLSMIAAIPGIDGTPIVLSDEEKAIVEVLSRPTNKQQVQVLTTIVARHGGKLGPAEVDLISKVVGPTAFKTELIKAGRIKDTGTSGTSPLIAIFDVATGLPVTPNGGDISLAFDDGSDKIFRL